MTAPDPMQTPTPPQGDRVRLGAVFIEQGSATWRALDELAAAQFDVLHLGMALETSKTSPERATRQAADKIAYQLQNAVSRRGHACQLLAEAWRDACETWKKANAA